MQIGKNMIDLNIDELQQVNGNGLDFGAAGAGGSLGGLFATGTLNGAAVGGALGVAAAASFSIGFAIGGFLAENTMIDEFIADAAFDLFN